MKKIIALFLAITMCIPLWGCGEKTIEDAKNDIVESTPEPTPTPNYDEQLKIIEDSRDTWMVDDWSAWFYSINDIDHNGRLDLIVASLQGTGMFTYANFWEVNETQDALVECTTEAVEGDSWPDIIKDKADCYYDSVTQRYYYVYEDEMKNGYAEYYFSNFAVCLHDGVVEKTPLSYKSVIYGTEDGKPKVTCTDINGNAISEEEYEKAADVLFEGMEKTIAQFEWTEIEPKMKIEPSLIFASDLYEGYGFAHQMCDQTGVYDFFSIESDGIVWEVYILDKEFSDAERFIPQAYEKALAGDGSISIKEGEWIYVYCPCNQWTTQTAPDGCAYSWNLNPEKEYTEREIKQDVPQGPVPVITKNPTSESLSVGGKTWFIAYADGADTVEWEMTNPLDGRGYSPAQAMALCKGLQTEVLDGNTLAIDNAPLSLSGWTVKAVFKNSFGTAETKPALITVEDFISKYSPVIENYKTMTPSDDVSEMISYCKHIGYALKDLDKNGIPELLIAGAGTDEFSQNMIFDIYTICDDVPVRLDVSRARSRLYIMTDNRILNQGSNGAAYNVNYVYRVNGTEMSVEEGVLSGLDENNNTVWYYTKDSDYEFSNDMQISEQEAINTVSAWENAVYLPQLTKIA